MDYIYAFRQANRDRLEDAGIHQYGYRNYPNYGSKVASIRKSIVQRAKLVATTIIGLVLR